LAALADDEPTTTEGEHLARCATCARERAAHRSLRSLAAGERFAAQRGGVPLTSWESLLPALRAEGLVAEGSTPATTPEVRVLPLRRRSLASMPWMRIAASVLLAAGGIIAGRMSAGAAPLPGLAASTVDTLVQAVADTLPSFRTASEALTALVRYERGYQAAAAYLAEQDTASRVEGRAAYEARLATLDQVAEVARQGLQGAPYDPVINQYYLTTLASRQATLRQLSTTLPSNMRVGGY
ncbi:MAG TPA: hypothetical protein VHM30_00460, partial [Gemmatimonadaceae bacterium]|nr:hypothetical protein [Gemmatimonadaceae bacterium]